MTILYLCNGEKPDCKQSECYKIGGGCKMTFDIEYARNFTREQFGTVNGEEQAVYVENTDLCANV